MEINKVFEKLISQIEKKEQMSPTLFLGENQLSLNSQIFEMTQNLLTHFSVDKLSFFVLEDSGKSIKIAELQEFFLKVHEKPRFAFQIFLIQNFGRITREAANSCLKVLEEPGQGNIIFLTNTTENRLLETILSRVQVVKVQNTNISSRENLYDSLLQNYLSHHDTALISYFFSEKLERSDYADFLETLIIYGKKHNIHWDFFDNIESDIVGLRYGTLSGKYIVDKYVFAL